jgi:hypothetical protein
MVANLTALSSQVFPIITTQAGTRDRRDYRCHGVAATAGSDRGASKMPLKTAPANYLTSGRLNVCVDL